jgi:hypothetical protein
MSSKAVKCRKFNIKNIISTCFGQCMKLALDGPYYSFVYQEVQGHKLPITVAARSKASSLAGTLGSWVLISLKAWMSVCVYSVFMLFSV